MYSERVLYPLPFRVLVTSLASFIFALLVLPLWYVVNGQSFTLTAVLGLAICAICFWVVNHTLGVKIEIEDGSTFKGKAPILYVRGNQKYQLSMIPCHDITEVESTHQHTGYVRHFFGLDTSEDNDINIFEQAGYDGPALIVRYKVPGNRKIAVQFPTSDPDFLKQELEALSKTVLV